MKNAIRAIFMTKSSKEKCPHYMKNLNNEDILMLTKCWNLYLFALLFDMVTRIVTYMIVFVVLVGKERVSNWIVPVMFY